MMIFCQSYFHRLDSLLIAYVPDKNITHIIYVNDICIPTLKRK